MDHEDLTYLIGELYVQRRMEQTKNQQFALEISQLKNRAAELELQLEVKEGGEDARVESDPAE